MSTMTGNLRRTVLFGAVGAVVLLGGLRIARADVASDRAGAILIFPKIVVDLDGVLGPPTDTEIQITNTSNRGPIAAHCFILDATMHCTTSGNPCTPAGGCAPEEGSCVQDKCSPKIAETNFLLTLTKRQPVVWKASEGIQVGQFPPPIPSGIPPVPARTFIGEIKCVEVNPVDFSTPSPGLDPVNNFVGDLKGEATIISVDGPTGMTVDARKYNGIGIQAIPGNFPPPPDGIGGFILSLGGPFPQYNACPSVVIMDNFFDGAPVITHLSALTHVTSDLTVIPCAEDLALQSPESATLQFLIFNEFEQRFSTSTSFKCFKEAQLSDIDTRSGSFGNSQSIFSFSTQGTITGQIRIRPVPGASSDNRVLAIGEEFWDNNKAPGGHSSAAANLVIVPGAGAFGDTIDIPSHAP